MHISVAIEIFPCRASVQMDSNYFFMVMHAYVAQILCIYWEYNSWLLYQVIFLPVYPFDKDFEVKQIFYKKETPIP